MKLPTTAIVNEDSKTGYSVINESDFDPKTHKRYKGGLAVPFVVGLGGRTLSELKKLASIKGLSGYSTMKKAELVAALESVEEAADLYALVEGADPIE